MSFNVRVYGVLIDRDRGVLVSDELINGSEYVKFPGGGLEYGEGTLDCLKREFKEELDLKIEVRDHLYTTDFFQESAFRPGDQIISVYYYVVPLETINMGRVHIDPVDVPFKISPHADRESFRFIALNVFSESLMSFPIDKVVAQKILRDQEKLFRVES